MSYQETQLSQVENVGALDRVNRILVGTTLIMVAVLFTAIPAAAVAGIVALGTYAGLTGFIGWDPVYVVVKAFRHPAPVQAPATLAAHSHHGEEASTGSYRKAA